MARRWARPPAPSARSIASHSGGRWFPVQASLRAWRARRLACTGDHRPRLCDAIDLALGAGGRAQRRAIVKIAAPIPITVPAGCLKCGFQCCCGGEPLRTARGFAAGACEGTPGDERRVQYPAEPDTLAFAALANAVHAIVPVARAHQRQAAFTHSEAVVKRARAVLVKSGTLLGRLGQVVGVVLAGLQRATGQKRDHLIKDCRICGRLHVICLLYTSDAADDLLCV